MSDSRCNKAHTNGDKWIISIIAGLLFLLVSSPFLYKATNELFTSLNLPGLAESSGCPNSLGLIVHAFVFILIVRLLMR